MGIGRGYLGRPKLTKERYTPGSWAVQAIELAEAMACVSRVHGIAPEAPVPIGRPIAGSHIYLLDSDLRPVPMGVHGEFPVGGVELTRAYLGRSELNAALPLPKVSRAAPSTGFDAPRTPVEEILALPDTLVVDLAHAGTGALAAAGRVDLGKLAYVIYTSGDGSRIPLVSNQLALASLGACLEEILARTDAVAVRHVDATVLAGALASEAAADLVVDLTNPAYVIYTSGDGGRTPVGDRQAPAALGACLEEILARTDGVVALRPETTVLAWSVLADLANLACIIIIYTSGDGSGIFLVGECVEEGSQEIVN